jgi:AbrB family looped-hinge helix DNA binding protein
MSRQEKILNKKTRARVNNNGRLVIPAQFREAFEIKGGDFVVVRLEDDELRVMTIKRRIERAQQIVRKYIKPGVSLVDELLAQRRAEARKEFND